jgi:hypothetical protein
MHDVFVQGCMLNTENINLAVTCLTYILSHISTRKQVLLSSSMTFLVTFLEQTFRVL